MRRTNRTTIAIVGGLIALIGVIVYLASRGNSDQDKLTDREVATTAPSSRAKLCASSATYDLIKRELFRRAAQVRGSDQAVYDRLAAYAVVRMENPVMESQNGSTGAVNCSGSLSLDLPPGVGVVGGRRTIASDIDYTLTTAADGSGNVVLLRNADAIAVPLAALTRLSEVQPSVPAAPTMNETMPEPIRGAAPTHSAATAIAPKPRPPPDARPRPDCRAATTRGEEAVCNEPGLAALDRQMMAQYGRALAAASPDERALLRETAERFNAYRNHCPTSACISDAYAERLNEIRDIMDGRWELPR